MERNLNRTLVLAVVAAFCIGAIMAGGVLYMSGMDAKASPVGPQVASAEEPARTDVSLTAAGSQPAVSAQFLLPGVGASTIPDIVAQAGPAVVKIDTEVLARGSSTHDPFLNDPFFRQFFGGSPYGSGSRVQKGMGSGFIISEDGYILTNQHVVDGADKILVTLSNGKEYEAQIKGADFDLDLAVLKIDVSGLPTLKLGDASKVRAGEWVIAIGNPYGLDHTVTVGVISAKGRPVEVDDRSYKDLLQTDASINPGNSGGPLLNLAGDVVGINTAINAQAQGIGFAIPSTTVQAVIQDLLTNGKVVRPWMGVGIQEFTKDLADYFGMAQVDGVLVTQVIAGGPADKAGIKRGDVIMEFNGKPVKTPDELITAIQATKIGQKVIVLVSRQGKSSYFTVHIDQKDTAQR